MIKKLLPVILAVFGLGAGVGAGVLLKPSAEAAADAGQAGHEAPAGGENDGGHASAAADDADLGAAASGGHGEAGGEGSGTAIVKLDNQFVVPVIDDAEVSALVVLSLDLEVDAGATETVHSLEPKLRDAFLRVLFEHANAGGFHGAFTSSGTMNLLRMALLESAEKVLGDVVHEVLITNIIRQSV